VISIASLLTLAQWPWRGGVLIVFATELMNNFGVSCCNFGVPYTLNIFLVLLSLAVGREGLLTALYLYDIY
jgi:hypothetical protein